MNVYEGILKNTNIVFFIVNPDGIIVNTNKYTMHILDDYSLVGKYFYSLVDRNTETNIRSALRCRKNICIDGNLKSGYCMMQPVIINMSYMENYLIILGFTKDQQNAGNIIAYDMAFNHESQDLEEYESKRKWQVMNIDALTGLYNKEFLKHILENKYNMALSTGGNVGLICFDLDIQDIQNIYGEEKANRIMVGFSQAMLTSTRNSDYCIRYDDKFLIITTNVKQDNLKKIAKRIASKAEDALGISVKWGTASTMDGDDYDKWKLFELAYENIGKNDRLIE